MTNRNRALLLAFASIVLPADAFGRRNNPPAGRTGSIASNGVTCTACHQEATGGLGSVQILGAPAAYELDQLYNLTVRISDPAQVGAGFQLSVEDAAGLHVGTLIVSDATNTELNDSSTGYINHTPTGVVNSVTNWSGSADYNVQWQAPSTDVGTITFWAAGNAIDDSFTLFGDKVYTTNVSANAAPPIPALSTVGLWSLAGALSTVGVSLLTRRRFPPRS